MLNSWLLQQSVEKTIELHGTAAQPKYNVETPLVSLVVPSVGEARWIERNLEKWLNQTQERYEVIIADASDDEGATHDVVKRAQVHAPHLRYTQLPRTMRNLHPRQAALSLGMRAARAPWVVLTQADCQPSSPQWLKHLKAYCTEDYDVVVGRVDFDDLGSECLRTSYEQQRRLAFNAACTLWGKACGGDARCIALRKEWWWSCGGFADSRELGYGECELLIDIHAEAHRIGFALFPETAVRQDIPEGEMLQQLRKEAVGLRRRLKVSRSWPHVAERLSIWAWALLGWAMFSFVLLRLAYFGGALCPVAQELGLACSETVRYYAWRDSFYDVPALLFSIWAVVGAIFSMRRTMSLLLPDYRGIRTLYPIVHDTLMPLRRSL